MSRFVISECLNHGFVWLCHVSVHIELSAQKSVLENILLNVIL